MVVLNFGHPITPSQLDRLKELTGREAEQVIEIKVQVEQDAVLKPQAVDAVDRAGLNSTQWQTAPLLISLPGYSPVAACILAEIEGRRGNLPSIIKTRPIPGGLVTEYEVVEIINLQEVRAEARTRR